MATKKIKKHRPKLRNRATVVLPRKAVRNSTARDTTALIDEDSTGWQAAKLGAGVLAGALGCALIARQDWLPPKTITGVATAVGTALLLGSRSETLKFVGAGAAAAAGGQLLLLTVDDQQRKPEQKLEQVASKDPPPPKRQADMDGLPPGALEAAYERARKRLEMTQVHDTPM